MYVFSHFDNVEFKLPYISNIKVHTYIIYMHIWKVYDDDDDDDDDKRKLH